MKIAKNISERDAIKDISLWEFDGEKWIGYENEFEIPPRLKFTPKISPPSVSAWQLRKALNQLGIRQSVELAVSQSGDQDIIDGWEYATEFERYNPLVLMIGGALNKSSNELDTIWVLAASL